MKNLTILLILIFSITLFACKNTNKKTTPNNTNTTSTPTNKTSQYSDSKPPSTSKEEVLYIKGGGNEPGWNIKITKETDTDFSFNLIMNYGQDKHSGVLTSSRNAEDETETFIGDDEKGNEITVIFKKENCQDDGDFDHNRTITLKMKGNTYMGCGDKK